MLSTTTFLLSKTFLLSQFSPPLQPMLSMIHVTRGHLRPYLTSFYPNFSPLCSPCFQLQHSFYQKHSFYRNFPPLCSPCFQLHSFYQKHSFYQNFPPLCSPCFQLQHSFYQTHSFYQHFAPPLQPMLSTTFLLSKFSPPLQPMLSMIHVTRGHLRPYLTSLYQPKLLHLPHKTHA